MWFIWIDSLCVGVWASLVVQQEPACLCRSHRRHEFDPRVRKIPWRRKWQPTPVFCLENPMDRGAWQTTVHSVAQSWTQLKQLSMQACVGVYPPLCFGLNWKRGDIIDWPKWIVQEVKEAVVRAAEVVELCLQLWALSSSASFQSQVFSVWLQDGLCSPELVSFT